MRKFLAISIIFVSIITPLSPSSAATAVEAGKAPCRIQIHDPHISGSLLKTTGKPFVKVDAESVCDLPQSQVLLTVELYKIGRFGGQLVARTSTDPKSKKSFGFFVTNYGTAALCISDATTTFYGLAYAKAIVAGKQLYAGTTFTKGFTTIKCGTK